MILRKSTALAVGALALTAAAVSAQVASFGGDKIKFPADYNKGVLYQIVDRADLKQYRELWGPAAAIEAAKKGQPMPDGTVLTLVQFKAKLGADGNPEKNAQGRFIKTDEIAGYAIMEKQKGWGASIPEAIRNGTWEYQAFKADKVVNDKANLKGCFECHQEKIGAKKDWLFSYDAMAAAK